MAKLTRYCLGFCFHEDLSHVVLLRKAYDCKVTSLRGLWNGVGGVIHDREDSLDGMIREWEEETDTLSPIWIKAGTVWIDSDTVVAVFGSYVKSEWLDNLRNIGNEPCELAPVWDLGKDYPTAPHVDWLVPMVQQQLRRVKDAKYAGEFRLNVDHPGRL